MYHLYTILFKTVMAVSNKYSMDISMKVLLLWHDVKLHLTRFCDNNWLIQIAFYGLKYEFL